MQRFGTSMTANIMGPLATSSLKSSPIKKGYNKGKIYHCVRLGLVRKMYQGKDDQGKAITEDTWINLSIGVTNEDETAPEWLQAFAKRAYVGRVIGANDVEIDKHYYQDNFSWAANVTMDRINFQGSDTPPTAKEQSDDPIPSDVEDDEAPF